MATTPLSPSETTTGITRGQASKLVEMAEHGLMKSRVFVGADTAQVDEFVKAVGSDMRDLFIAQVERRFQAHIGRYIVPVNYGAENAIATALDENAFNNKYIYVDIDKIPLDGTGEVVEELREVHYGKVMYNRDLPAALKQTGIEAGFVNGYKFTNVLAALRWAKLNADNQRKYPIAILFYIGGQLCYLCLNGDADERIVYMSKLSPDARWDDFVRFLVAVAAA